MLHPAAAGASEVRPAAVLPALPRGRRAGAAGERLCCQGHKPVSPKPHPFTHSGPVLASPKSTSTGCYE